MTLSASANVASAGRVVPFRVVVEPGRFVLGLDEPGRADSPHSIAQLRTCAPWVPAPTVNTNNTATSPPEHRRPD